MTNFPAAKTPRPSPAESEASLHSRARRSMRRWTEMNEPARLLGRGLGRKELVARVALDVGATTRQVHCALKERP